MHSHLLPGVDDGARSWEEAVALARSAHELAGVTHLALTPHWVEGQRNVSPSQVLEGAGRLRAMLAAERIPVELLAGAEVYLAPELPRLLRAGELLTLGGHGRHLLVELPLTGLPGFTERLLFELALEGVTVILAHPERNAELARSPRRVAGLVRRGALVQLNAGSLVGAYGRPVRLAAEYLARRHLVHFLGSDVHHRPFEGFGAARRRLAELAGEEAARAILWQYPEAVWQGRGREGPRAGRARAAAPPCASLVARPPLVRRGAAAWVT